jgi:[FeFe] hydrogenase H-cluster maturation GTPase HydF
MYNTPASNRLHIGIFGKRNTGKSSLINALTGQNTAIVSPVAGTTTDPVRKAMEINPIGPCMLIDTAGIDDEGALGEERVRRSREVLRKTDLVIIVVEPDTLIDDLEEGLMADCKARKIPFLFVLNKGDLKGEAARRWLQDRGLPCVEVSAQNKTGIEELKKKIIAAAPANWSPVPLVADLIQAKDTVVLVCPVDGAMPQGRLILPQVQVLRDILDCNAIAHVTKDTELVETLRSLSKPPRLVITDSQVFAFVRDTLPQDIPLTSFSIIFARHKGDINAFVEGVRAVDHLKDGDEILIAEVCTHHPFPEDIGRYKIPKWLREHTAKDLRFTTVAGADFPADLARYKLIVSCGGCMVNRHEIMYRVGQAKAAGVPITNYGVLIAYLSGILPRVLEPLRAGCVPIGFQLR